MDTLDRITLTSVDDLTEVEALWREFEAQARPSFFQSWTWVGCLAAERFPDPVLLRAERHGRIVGLALLNRRRGRLRTERLALNESGDPAIDAVYVEHNGILLAHGADDLLPACLRALVVAPVAPRQAGRRIWRWGRRLRLGGVDAAHLTAARQAGVSCFVRESTAPYVDLAALPEGSDGYLASLSANTRYQIRRSDRGFARLGPLMVRRAETVAEAHAFLDALAALHEASWAARGTSGAFSNPDFVRFHRALIARALPRDELALLRITAGPHLLGYLYNFRLGDRVFSYQSGFDYSGAAAVAGRHAKTGLTCHHAAILRARAEGASVYDFLAGPHRYKMSLARAATRLYWVEGATPYSVQHFGLRLRSLKNALFGADTADGPVPVGIVRAQPHDRRRSRDR